MQLARILFHILLVTTILNVTYGAKILFFFALSTYSHRIAVWSYVEQLAAAGHEVTFVQPYPPKKPNPKVSEFYPQSVLNSSASPADTINLLKLRLDGGRAAIDALTKGLMDEGVKVCSKFLAAPETQDWISKSKFDLVVIDDLMNECGYGLAHKFGAKTAIFMTSHPIAWRFEPFGILLETSWIPDLLSAPDVPLGFWDRVKNTLGPLFLYVVKQYSYYPKLDKVFQETLGLPGMPSVSELERETSLIFANTHYSEEFARSLPPLFVSVGGMHCADASQKLTPELEKFISSSPNGFIYVSFGSAAKISEAPEAFQDIFYTAMANSKMNFIWKYEGERHEKIPKNVYTAKWLPQQAILGHPKAKAFLTHGGLLGIQEAVWYGVPLLAMPVFAEQDYNAKRVQRTQRGIMLDPNILTLPVLEKALSDIVANPIYKKKMQQLSMKFKDRPMKPVESALWWTEYILRFDDHSNLKPLGMHQNWFVRRSLDVWSFVGIFVLIVVYLLTKILNFPRGNTPVPRKVKTK